MNDVIKLRKDGTEFDGNLICYFQNTTSSRKFVFYTKSDEDAANSPTIKVHVALISQADATLNAPINDEEWTNLKGLMGNVLKGAATPDVSYLKTSNTLDIADEKVIGMPSSYDYVSKHKTVYANEAKEDTTPAVETPVAPTPAQPTAPEGPIIPDVPGAPTEVSPEVQAATPEAPSVEPIPSAPAPEATPGFGGAMEAITPTNVEDVNPIQSLIPDAPGEGETPEDKPLPNIPEAPTAPEAPMNENIQIPPVAEPEPAVPIAPEIPSTPEPAIESTSAGTLTSEEINAKFDNIVNEINALREEALKMVNTSSPSSAPSPSAPSDVTITPIEPAATPASNEESAADEGTNWFDMPNN